MEKEISNIGSELQRKTLKQPHIDISMAKEVGSTGTQEEERQLHRKSHEDLESTIKTCNRVCYENQVNSTPSNSTTNMTKPKCVVGMDTNKKTT
mgnify:FL=1